MDLTLGVNNVSHDLAVGEIRSPVEGRPLIDVAVVARVLLPVKDFSLGLEIETIPIMEQAINSIVIRSINSRNEMFTNKFDLKKRKYFGTFVCFCTENVLYDNDLRKQNKGARKFLPALPEIFFSTFSSSDLPSRL